MKTEPVEATISLGIGEVFAETDDLSPEEFAAYLRLQFHMWARGGILPHDPERLARLARIDRPSLERVWPVVGKFFVEQEGTLTIKRLAQDLERAREVRDSIAEKGSKGGRKAKQNRQLSLAGLSPEQAAELPAEQVAELVAAGARAKKDLLRKSGSESGSPRSARAPFSHPDLIRLFSDLWKRIYFEEYMPTPADRSQLGRVLGGFHDTAAIEAFPWRATWEAYLADDDKFVAGKQRHSLAHFCTSGGMNKYRTRDRTAGFSEQDIANSQAKRAWVDNGRAR